MNLLEVYPTRDIPSDMLEEMMDIANDVDIPIHRNIFRELPFSILLTDQDERLIAWSCFSIDRGDNSCYIGYVIVRRDSQKKGIGSLIFTSILSYLKKECKYVRKIYLRPTHKSEKYWKDKKFYRDGIYLYRDI